MILVENVAIISEIEIYPIKFLTSKLRVSSKMQIITQLFIEELHI